MGGNDTVTHRHFEHHQIPHKLAWEHTQSSTVTGWQLNCLGHGTAPVIHVYTSKSKFFSIHGATAPIGQGLLIIEASLSHSETPDLVGLPWTSNQPNTRTSNWQHTTLTRDRHLWRWLDLNPQSQQAGGHRPMWPLALALRVI